MLTPQIHYVPIERHTTRESGWFAWNDWLGYIIMVYDDGQPSEKFTKQHIARLTKTRVRAANEAAIAKEHGLSVHKYRKLKNPNYVRSNVRGSGPRKSRAKPK